MERGGQTLSRSVVVPALSLATSGTHDTETLAEWWDEADSEERGQAVEWPALRAAGCDPSADFDDRLRDGLLQTLFASGSNLVVVPVQDIFGWRDRINTPAVVDDVNWRWRMPWPVDVLGAEPVPRERAAFLKRLAAGSGRYLR